VVKQLEDGVNGLQNEVVKRVKEIEELIPTDRSEEIIEMVNKNKVDAKKSHEDLRQLVNTMINKHLKHNRSEL
jgi:hypothetical protein